MSKLKLFLFGSPQLEIDRTPIELGRRKAMALLAYLAVTGKSHSRDTLAVLLWPEADQSQARSTLRRNLSVLNKALGDGWLDINRETIGLRANPDLWVDVNQFRQALAMCREHDHTAANVCPACLPHLKEAVSTYQDNFLAGFTLRDSPEFDDWQLLQAETLHRELGNALEQLVRRLSSQEDFKAAIPYARRWLALDPLREAAHRQLMELYARAGQRAAALHQYTECERILHEELGLPPGVETIALAERIRRETNGQQGQLIKSYELHELIGAGGFGEVYRAYQPQVRREVAIKAILPQYANQPEFIRRFESEARMVAQLEHPHIVPLYDYWREPDGAYLVMRWLRGGSLADSLKGGLWQPQATAQLLDQIASALTLAHRRGIIHCDLKPANILLDESGHAYLSDFGIAKTATAYSSNSEAGYVLASPAYASPETLDNETPAPQTDIYSLGVILYETLTGGHPFPDTTPPMMIIKHMSEPLPSLCDARPDLPVALNNVIQQATAKNPVDRYADALSLAGAFRRALGSDQAPATVLPDESTPLLVPNPYKGLHAFQEGDASDFFGRDALVDQLLMRLTLNRPTQRQPFNSTHDKPLVSNYQSPVTNLHNFLAIVGPSGSGKSSLVKAGLLPALRQNAIPGSRDWFMIDMTPGLHPLEALETALLRVAINPPPTLLEQLQSDERGLLRAVKHILPNEESRLLLVIDQFEEIFTLVEDEAVRNHFLASLYAAVTDPDSHLRVVITLRADFYDRPLLYPGFGDLLRQRMETVLPLSSEELEQAITGPAGRVGATFEPGLIPLIISDVQEQPGSLPLMQYALTELYQRRQGRRLTLDAYQASGGVFGALARRAEELYTELDDTGRAATRRLFLRLVTVGETTEDTRRRVLRSELETMQTSGVFETSEVFSQVIDTFGLYRLLTFDRDPVTRGPTVEVAHEALIREWGRLQQWLDNDREFLMWQQRLRAGLHQWKASEQDEGALFRGAPLAEAENWLNQRHTDLNEVERDFIQASLALREQREIEREVRLQRELEMEKRRAEEQTQSAHRLRLRNRVITAVGVMALVLAGAAALFGWQSNQNAIQASARELASAALANLEVDPQLSILLALESLDLSQSTGTAPLAGAQDALHQGIHLSRLEFSLLGHSADITGLAYSPDTPEGTGGRWLASSSTDGTTRLWDVVTREEVTVLRGHEGAVNDLAFSPDGKLLATVGDDITLRLWDMTTFQARVIPTPHTGWVTSVAFSGDGTRLVTTSAEESLLWDVPTAEIILTRSSTFEGDINDATISPNGLTIVTAHEDNGLSMWSAANGSSANFPGFLTHWYGPDGARAWSIAFSPDNKYLLSSYYSGMVKLWEVESGENVHTLYHTGTVFEVAFDSTGERFATASEDGTAKIWNTKTGRELLTLYGSESGVAGAVFSPDDRYVATANGAELKVWDISPTGSQEWLDIDAHNGGVTGFAYSSDGRYWATGGVQSVFAIWDAESGELEHQEHFGRANIKIQNIAFSPDSRALVYVADYDLALVWNLETKTRTGGVIHSDRITGAAYRPDGKYLATSSFDGTVRVWDAVGSDDVQAGETIFELKRDGSPINDVAYDSGGHYLAAGNRKGEVMVWDASNGQFVIEWAGHTGAVSRVSFSSNGQYLATAGFDGIVKLWDAGTFELVSTLTGHRGAIHDLIFSPDSASLATASSDGTAKVWPLAGGEPVTLRGHRQGVEGVAFSPDGKRLAAAGQDGSVRVYALDLADLVAMAQSRLTRSLTTEECRQYLHTGECL